MNLLKRFSFYKRKGTVFLSWVILFCVMFLIALLFMGVYFYKVNSTLERNLVHYNDAKLHQVKTEFDAAALKLSLMAESLASDEASNQERLYSYDERRILFNKLSLLLETNRDICEIMIYLPDSDEIVTASCVAKASYFYYGYMDTALLTLDEWQKFLKDDKTNYYSFLPLVNLRGEKDYKLTYVLRAKDNSSMIMVALNAGSMLADDPYFSKVLMYNGQDNPYCVYGLTEGETYLSAEELPENTGIFKTEGNSYISYTEASIPGMSYVVYTEKSVFNKDLYSIQVFSVLYMLVFLILGLVLAWWFSLRQYKPLGGIVDKLKNLSESKEPQKRNEYLEIESSISKILQESAKLSREARKRNAYVRERAVVNLLNGRMLSAEMKALVPTQSGEVTIVRLICDEDKAVEFGNDLDLLQFAVKNIAEELFSHIAETYPAELDGAISLFLRLKDGVTETDVYEVAEQLSETMKTQMSMDMEIVIGRIVTEMERLPSIYGEILEASQFCTGAGEILRTSLLPKEKAEAYTYSVQTEIDIISFIKNGDFDGADRIITDEFQKLIVGRNYPVYLVRCFMIDVASTILKAAGEVSGSGGESMNQKTQSIGKLFSSASVTEMEGIVREYLREVCDFVIESNSQCSSTVCEDIKLYIKEHFADAELNVNQLAERFYLNSAYLSNMFKKNTGMKLSEFINKIRIAEAKKLIIKNPEMSMEQVAELTGYANSRTFRRIFLKYEEVPPSKFVTHHR